MIVDLGERIDSGITCTTDENGIRVYEYGGEKFYTREKARLERTKDIEQWSSRHMDN